MEKILGLDLGTNSIGWAIRNTSINGNDQSQIEKFGVRIFSKGVGEGKTGEFSYAAERTKHRSKRRLYQARRYRIWATLEVLIQNGYCPLTIDELNGWRKYSKEAKRQYPHSKVFEQWIRLDFNGDGRPDYQSPYQLRKLSLVKQLSRLEVGRALYHIAQRRGFKSSRKLGDNERTAVYDGSKESGARGVNEILELIEKQGTLGAALAKIEQDGERIRNRYTLRKHYKEEAHKICEAQGIDIRGDFYLSIDKAIFYQRPLRSQKGLVGKCTLEPKKSRCPISHPAFEEFRARAFLNNIKYFDEVNQKWHRLAQNYIEEIIEEKFLRQKPDFTFDEIGRFLEKKGLNSKLNYKDYTAVTGSPVSARFKNIFGNDWLHIIIPWKNKTYSINDIWHALLSFEDEEFVLEFALVNLQLDDTKSKAFVAAWRNLPDGYSMLSLNAIQKILPFLRDGLGYTEAVMLANIPSIIGNTNWTKEKESIIKDINSIIEESRKEKTIINIANNLISQYYALAEEEKFGYKNNEYKLDDIDKRQVEEAIVKTFGKKSWELESINKRAEIIERVISLYQNFFQSTTGKHYKIITLKEKIADYLMQHSYCSKKDCEKLYHPSQIDIYPAVKPNAKGIVLLGNPQIGSFKNPMAMRTMHELRILLNHLISTDQIDESTNVVVEVARQLNDANKRWAIEMFQRNRQFENQEFAKVLVELNKDGYTSISPENPENIDRFRLWYEQLVNGSAVFDEVKKLKSDIEKYRLWKEQNCQCFYTGRMIKLTDLFDENTIDFEHTIPRSKSFDNSLENMTVCYAFYNRDVKRNKIPSELPNYHFDTEHGTAILPRLKIWEDRVIQLTKNVENAKRKSKVAKDKTEKDAAIRQRHLWQFELDYWSRKVDRFKINEITSGFKNSQLVDTQLISKYAFHYLKSFFNRVDVQKGSTTSEFRKIYQIQPSDEVKDRSMHSHHAIDAAVLTLIPSAVKRDRILEEAYRYKENYGKQYYEKPYPSFHYNHVNDIKEKVLVDAVSKTKIFDQQRKIVKKRGRIVYLRDNNGLILKDNDGTPKPMIAQGDSVRGQLHLDSFYGKIKVAKRDESGKPILDGGKYVFEEKNNGFRFVKRKLIQDLTKLDEVVDPNLRRLIEMQLNGRSLSQAVNEGIWMLNHKGERVHRIRHIRCFANDIADPLQIKRQTYISKRIPVNFDNNEHKQYYWAKNGENALYGFYQTDDKTKRGFELLNLMQISQIRRLNTVENVYDFFAPNKEVGKGKNRAIVPLYSVLQPGLKVLFYKEDQSELKGLSITELSKRLYSILVLFDKEIGRIKFQHHLEARNDKQLQEAFPDNIYGKAGKNGFSTFSWDFVCPRLLLSLRNFDFVVEGRDFEMKPDGSIRFKF